ncbi:MAG: zinc-ribbon domain-containing protein [Clostridia bacterium]|nr:zinc-ribbon domain-containing protein [Clostridia bacterium]
MYLRIWLIHLLFHFVTNDERKRDIWAGRYRCPRCGKVTDFHLTKTEKTLLAFFIPVMAMTDDRFIECDECGYEKKLRIHQYNSIRKSKYESIKRREFPLEMVYEDFSPLKLKYTGRIAKMIVSGMILLLMLVLLLFGATETSQTESVIIMLIFCCIPLSIPFCLSIKGLLPYMKKDKIFDHLGEFPSLNNPHSLIDYHIPGSETILSEPCYSAIYSAMDRRETPHIADTPQYFGTTAAQTAPVSAPTVPTKEDVRVSGLKKWIYSLLCMIRLVPKRYQSNPKFEIAFHKLSGNKLQAFYVVHLIFLFLTFVTVGISFVNNTFTGILVPLFVSIVFLIVTLCCSPGIMHSLKTLADTGNIMYIDEVLPYIGTIRTNVIFREHLLYDKPERVIVAYADIVAGYSAYDNNNYRYYTVLCTVDGRNHKTTITDELLYEFKLRTPSVKWESK